MPRQPSRTPSDLLAQADRPAAPDLGWTSIPLPSRGVLYDGKMPGGVVQMRRMMAREANQLRQQGGSPLERIEAIVTACAKLPSGFHQKELLLTDSFFMMLTLRTLSFGPKYKFRFRCQFCSSTEQGEIDIAEDLDEKAAADDLVEPFEIPLVDSACAVSVRFLRIEDQSALAKYVKRTKMTTVDQDDPSYTYRLALSLVARDGESFTDILKKLDFVKSLTAADLLRLDQGIQEREPGVDLRIFPDCKACGATNEMGVPFDAEFFRPTRI